MGMHRPVANGGVYTHALVPPEHEYVRKTDLQHYQSVRGGDMGVQSSMYGHGDVRLADLQQQQSVYGDSIDVQPMTHDSVDRRGGHMNGTNRIGVGQQHMIHENMYAHVSMQPTAEAAAAQQQQQQQQLSDMSLGWTDTQTGATQCAKWGIGSGMW